jgi:hypothetical protein
MSDNSNSQQNLNIQNSPKKPKRVYDWIKYRNIKEATVNYSALKGLKRVNKILSFFIKMSIAGVFIGYGCYALYTHYIDIFDTRIKQLEKMINTEGEDERKIVYLNNHIKLGIDYGRNQIMDQVEDKSGITYYREKLLKNASGIVLETCKNISK